MRDQKNGRRDSPDFFKGIPFMQPLKLLREAIKAVPAMRYALGVAGIVAVVAIVAAFKLDPKVAVFGAIITLGLMVGLVIFARLTKIASAHLLKPVLVMMWSFLVLIIAQATLLFSAVSFRQPKALADWLFPIPLTNGPSAGLSPADAVVSPEILEAARLQSDAGDHAGAWKQIENGLKAAPNFRTGLHLQASIAMKWLRQCFGWDHSELVDRVSPSLYRAANSTNPIWNADVYAHIGWGNYLKSKAGHDLDFEAQFKRAVALDSTNTFAHTMWGYCIIWTRDGAGVFKEASDHFEIAAQSGRERDYVRELQLAALGSRRVSEHVLDFIRVVNNIRKVGDIIDPGKRRGILSDVYWSEWKPMLDSVNSAHPVLPSSEHLATMQWLKEGVKSPTVHTDFFIARLTEQTGDRPGALALYRAITLIKYPGPGYGDLEKDIKEGMVRCNR